MEERADIAALRSQIQEPRLRRFAEYWHGKRGARRYPARRDIDPLEFSYVLGDVMLLDVLREPLRFRCRLHGTNMALRAGYDLTGKMLHELPGSDYRQYVQRRCETLIAAGDPLVTQYNRILDGRRLTYEALWLPFSDDGQNISLLICALIYQDQR